MNRPGMVKQAFQGVGLALLVLGAFFVGDLFFGEDIKWNRTDLKETPIGGVTLPDGRTLAQPNPEGLSGQKIPVQSSVKRKREEGSRTKMEAHPKLGQEEILKREVRIPENVKDKWKAVKFLIKNKQDEEENKFQIVELGQTFELENGITAIVGPFLPNFVMNELYYTSMNNQLLNPAVHVTVKENGKTIYDGWTFARYPDLYAFEHDRYGIQLTDYIPKEVS